MAFDQQKYIDDYNREKYDRVTFRVLKGKKQLLKETATRLDIVDDKGQVSINRLITEALEAHYGIDLSSPD